MNKITTLLFMLLFSLTVSAQSDFDIAKEFMSKKGVTLKNNPSKTRGENKPYSVFNGEDGKGFAIVVNGSVVGYDTENTANEDDMPCCLKEVLLKQYPTKTAKTRGEDYTPNWWTPRNVTPIKPLMTTKWSQNSPYNDIERRNGICAGIAFAQILHYFRIPQTFEDRTTSDGEYFPITTFNHDLMLDEYVSGKYTEEEAYEVAKFIHYYCHIDCYGLEDVFGMEEHWVSSDENNHYAKFDEYLEQGIPLWAAGSYNGGGHAFVIDGRDSEGRYHANLGWGGNWDGYYVLPDNNEHFGTYNEGIPVLTYMNTCTSGFYYIIPKLFSWSYTTNIYKPNFDIAKASNTDVYNLQGVKVGNSLEDLPKGVYIQGGKKYIVK